MVKCYFIDTNIFLHTLIRRDEKCFADCSQFLEKVKLNQVKAVTANMVLAEAVWTLKSFYGFSRQQVVKGIKSIVRLRGLRLIDGYDVSRALNFFQNSKVKYIDAMIASIKQIDDKKWIVVSYDNDFDKLQVIRKEPGDI